MSLKMRSAPAAAAMMLLICMLICVTGMEKLRFSVRNETSVPSESFTAPLIARAAPATAQST